MKRSPENPNDRSEGRLLWRSLDGTADKALAAAASDAAAWTLDRREWLKLMSASLALAGLAGCGERSEEEILPYVRPPAQGIQGEPRHYATAALFDGYAVPVIATSYMGRPVKLEGNPRHPASAGATDIFAQAALLQLWDPERSALVLRNGVADTHVALLAELQRHRPAWQSGRGALRILTGTLTSPTLTAQLLALEQCIGSCRWHQYQPVNQDAAQVGAQLAFGATVDTRWHLQGADRVLAFDCDFLGPGPGQVRHARDFMRARRDGERGGAMNRLYVLESSPSLTGANADHRWALSPAGVQAWLYELARNLGAVLPAPVLEGMARRQVREIVVDLRRQGGRSLVLAGRSQPAEVHALVHWINARLGNVGTTLSYHAPVQARVEDQTQSLRELVHDLNAGRVDTLIVIGGNPVYDAPRDLEFARALEQVPLSVHMGLSRDETALRTRWHVPLAHALESWGDARAPDGTVSILQPLIAPLYGGHSPHTLVAALAGEPAVDAREQVRSHWRARWGEAGFEQRWESVLREGLVGGSAAPARTVKLRADLLAHLPPVPAHTGLSLTLAPDATMWDGQYSNNAWLQELPKPMTQLTWDNAALVSPRLAQARGLSNGDKVLLKAGAQQLETAVWVTPGQADDVVTLSLGYGRTQAGQVGSHIGFDAYGLRRSDAMWVQAPLTLQALGGRYALASTQEHHRMEGRAPVRRVELETFLANPRIIAATRAQGSSLYPPYAYPGHAWGMSVNLNACIGCSACTIACQAENNIPVVGKDQVQRGREMHWIRVDRYYEGRAENPRTYFQPVPCMHCEHAPCELVCPVDATLHDSEGLNLQVYNRCVGTRFCSNNCPYKVRRFNFLQYADGDSPARAAQRNPEVTVRMRGVMEKCSYCIQRIERGRIRAEREDRALRDGEVVTACQQVCPTGAIVFGDINDGASAVSRAKRSPLDYTLLAELNTRPRTTYGARLRNPNPLLPKDAEEEG